MKRTPASNFSSALRLVRKAKGLTQEDFDDVTSRVYISALERGVKQPTLPKVDALAIKLGVHPLTLLALAYGPKTGRDTSILLEQVLREIDELHSL